MKTKILAALLVAASATLAAPAFASGYGPAPFYHPTVGAPASQRGESAQTVAAERAAFRQDCFAVPPQLSRFDPPLRYG